jgi:hypothetical protein
MLCLPLIQYVMLPTCSQKYWSIVFLRRDFKYCIYIVIFYHPEVVQIQLLRRLSGKNICLPSRCPGLIPCDRKKVPPELPLASDSDGTVPGVEGHFAVNNIEYIVHQLWSSIRVPFCRVTSSSKVHLGSVHNTVQVLQPVETIETIIKNVQQEFWALCHSKLLIFFI